MTAPLFDGLPPIGSDDAANSRVVRVALPVPIDRLFDYRVPAAHNDEVVPGTRVRVRFAGQEVSGLVVPKDLLACEDSLAAEDATRELSEIDAVIDEEPVVSESMMRILAEAAREIYSPIGLALAHALPPGSTPRTARPYALTPRGERALAQRALGADALGGDALPLLKRLADKALTLGALSKAFPRIDVSGRLASLVADGLIERRFERRGPTARIPIERIALVAPDIDAHATSESQLARAPRQAALLRQLAAAKGGIATRWLTKRDSNVGTHLRSLAARGFIVFEERPRTGATETVLDGGGEVTLTKDQAEVLIPIHDSIKRQIDQVFLLHGVTGSGKTEVYLRAVAEALSRGRQALVLVPEITLTHQIVARVRARFGDQVAVLHSGLKPGERLAQWERLRTGQTRIAVGARSALFAPLEKLGLIVVDEEHDGAYKNDEGFRYHARELARKRAEDASCPLILGSATPSLESRYRAERGEITRLSLPRRVGGRPLPAVEIIDLGREKDKNPRGRKLILSKPLRGAIEAALDDGGQTILFLNRRGFSTRVFCFQCGHAERCDDCDVALVFHSAEYRLRCHYCDLVRTVPEECSGCGDPETALLGVGTERLEEEVSSLFPKARVMRLDRDLARKRGHTESVLRGLKNEDVDIVIGTQMVAKGHDFPGVQLVGVIAADIGLHLPDFRAAERTFQLLTQVAGRAGRAERPGRVVVQTFVPDHYALAPVATHDYEGFYREEILHREELGYPPFGQLTRTVVHAEDEEATKLASQTLARAARALIPAGARLEVLGPAPAPIAKLRGRHRAMLLFKGTDEALLRRVTEATLAAARSLPREVQVALDARPVNML
jgi:primosomal protein N' (replication factor Y)